MRTMVLKKFTVNENAEEIVCVEGRRAGLISWLLNLMGIDNTISLKCTKDKIEYKSAGLSGATSMTIPLQAVSSIKCRYK